MQQQLEEQEEGEEEGLFRGHVGGVPVGQGEEQVALVLAYPLLSIELFVHL